MALLFASEQTNGFHSYASRIGSKMWAQERHAGEMFPFIRFTNWKQEPRRGKVLVEEGVFPFIRFTNWKQESFTYPELREILRFHSYASRIGSKLIEGEGIGPEIKWFPFIRFTNWKQDEPYKDMILSEVVEVSIHTLHELEARQE